MMNISQTVLSDIRKYAELRGIHKVILFGSRARGTNSPKSDIDIAVTGGNIFDFYYDLEEKARTLLMFDVINLDKGINSELAADIDKEGVVIYEKV